MSGGCRCGAAPKLIFACSGAADVGGLADLAARKLTREGKGQMFCLAGIGGEVPGILQTTAGAAGILAIDGCPVDCAKKSLRRAGFTGMEHLQLADLGLEKGSSPATEENVDRVCRRAAGMLAEM